MSDPPPPKEKLFSFEAVFFVGGGVHGEGSVAEAAQGGGASSRLGGMTPPPSMLEPTAEWVRQYAPKGGRPGKQTKRGREVVVVEPDAPPPHRGRGPTPCPKPSPKPSKVAKVAAQPHPEALDVEALGASVATHVTDACHVLVEQAAATGVEAALAKGRSANHKSALAKAEKVQGNTQRALDQALNLAAKRGEEVEAMRGALKEAQEGRQKAEVEAAV